MISRTMAIACRARPRGSTWRTRTARVGVVQPLPGGELLNPGSSDERLVEDDGSVLVLASARPTLGCDRRECLPARSYHKVKSVSTLINAPVQANLTWDQGSGVLTTGATRWWPTGGVVGGAFGVRPPPAPR